MTSRLVQCVFSTERFLAHTVRLLLLLDSSGCLKSLLSHKGRCSQQCCFPLAVLGSWCRDRFFVYRHGPLIFRPVSFWVSLGKRCRGAQKRRTVALPGCSMGRQSQHSWHCRACRVWTGGKLLPSSRMWQPDLNHQNLTSPR